MKKSALLLFLSLLIPSLGHAQNMQAANGVDCYPTEKTYFEEDGVTPFACVPAGGPAYDFQVYDGDMLLWEGVLPETEADIFFDLADTSDNEGNHSPRLLIERDLNADPLGGVVFFGVEQLESYEQFNIGNDSVYLPKIKKVGVSIQVVDGEIDASMSRLKGSVIDGEIDAIMNDLDGSLVDFNNYRLVVNSVE